jgi:drug/metabolite transporter (DMT)-like permease
MEIWVFAAISAAFFQTLRFMLQKVLSTSALSAVGATAARFFYSMPVIWVLVIGYVILADVPWAVVGNRFWLAAAFGGATQIFATVCVVALFKARNFAVGMTFKKTEVIQVAIVSAIILGEFVSTAGFMAILVGVVGVLLVSHQKMSGGTARQLYFNRASGLGLLSGFLFALSGVSYRAASLEIASTDAFLRAALTLMFVVTWQSFVMALWLRFRDPDQIRALWQSRRTAIWVGLTSMAGSYMWFVAFTLQNAAYVNAVGQIELIFSILASWLFFREKITKREIAGIVTIMASVLGLILATH